MATWHKLFKKKNHLTMNHSQLEPHQHSLATLLSYFSVKWYYVPHIYVQQDLEASAKPAP
jgi:hypothetical protein